MLACLGLGEGEESSRSPDRVFGVYIGGGERDRGDMFMRKEPYRIIVLSHRGAPFTHPNDFLAETYGNHGGA